MEYVADNGYPTVMTAKDVDRIVKATDRIQVTDRIVKATDRAAEVTDRNQSDG